MSLEHPMNPDHPANNENMNFRMEAMTPEESQEYLRNLKEDIDAIHGAGTPEAEDKFAIMKEIHEQANQTRKADNEMVDNIIAGLKKPEEE